MSRIRHRILTAVATGLVLVVVGAAPAGAVPAPAARGPATGTAAALPAVSPSISPAVATGYVDQASYYDCGAGNFCAVVWDPTVRRYKIFYLYRCQRYALHDWFGDGSYNNNQTGGAVAILYDRNLNKLRSAPADGLVTGMDWTPVWYIRNC